MSFNNGHSHREIERIREFVVNSDTVLTVDGLAKFIEEAFDIKWNTNDPRTREYLTEIMYIKTKKRRTMVKE